MVAIEKNAEKSDCSETYNNVDCVVTIADKIAASVLKI